MKPWHLFLCALFVATTVLLLAVGVGALAVIPALGCAVMMGVMVWMMVRMGGHGGGEGG